MVGWLSLIAEIVHLNPCLLQLPQRDKWPSWSSNIFFFVISVFHQMNMLMRLQEAANYSSPQSYDSDSNSNSHHDDILDSSLESTLWIELDLIASSGPPFASLRKMNHQAMKRIDLVSEGHLSIRAARTIQSLPPSPPPPFSVKDGCRQPSWCFISCVLFSLIRTALFCFCFVL